MTKPIPDKTEVALEYPDKLYRASMPLGAPVMTDRRIRTLFAISLLCFAIPAQAQIAPVDDPVKALVGRLDLEKYKAVIKGLTQFGDRQQGTDRNKAAIDWIEAQLRSYGCANTERVKYVYPPPPQSQPSAGSAPGAVIASGE